MTGAAAELGADQNAPAVECSTDSDTSMATHHNNNNNNQWRLQHWSKANSPGFVPGVPSHLAACLPPHLHTSKGVQVQSKYLRTDACHNWGNSTAVLLYLFSGKTITDHCDIPVPGGNYGISTILFVLFTIFGIIP